MTTILIVLLVVLDVIAVGALWWWLVRPRKQRAREWQRAHELFSKVVELEETDRRVLLDSAAANDATLRDAVESLLDSHDKTGPLDRLERSLITNSKGGESQPAITTTNGKSSEPLVAGHYRLLERLGAGGMGEVYRAHDTQLGRDIAIKFLSSDHLATASSRERFIREARSAAKLDHPNICTVHQIGEAEDGRLYIAMALYDGETLADRIGRGPLDWNDAAELTLQIARGLECAHAAGVIHRDIKPANICITGDNVVKIVDFGIAMMAGNTMADGGALLGTVSYMSPEQVNGDQIDRRTDLWSLGVVLHEMLTGERLFAGNYWPALLASIRAEGPVPLSRLRGTAPLPVLRVIRRLLERDREARPGTAAELERELQSAIQAPEGAPEQHEDAEQSGLAAGGERHQITVLVAGTTADDPASTDDELDGIELAIRDIVGVSSGHLHRLERDRMVAIFGLPHTHEDDQLRAVRAAFDLNELISLGTAASGQSSGLGIGIASGTVEVGVDLERPGHYRLADDVEQIASTLMTLALPGEVFVSQPEVRQLDRWYTLLRRDSTPQTLLDSIPNVAKVVPAGTDGEQRVGANETTQFAGRDTELEALVAAIGKAGSGDGQIVTVVGEAGAGKSRLLSEFELKSAAAGFDFVTGNCHALVQSGPYHPFVEVIEGLIGAQHLGSAEEIATALEAIDPKLSQFLPRYLELLSVDTASTVGMPGTVGSATRTEIRDALTALVTMAAQQRPLVVLLEDWHWSDEASREVLYQLAGVGVSYPLILVVTQRPDPESGWDGSRNGSLLVLKPLSLQESTSLIEAMTKPHAVPAETASALHARSGGNPFYLEELVRSMRESGLLDVVDGILVLTHDSDKLHLPSTVQGTIRSRIDRLSEGARQVLRSASVLGREFSLKTLQQMGLDRYLLSRQLQLLTGLGMIRQHKVLPERTYQFSHVLLQEVAYDTLLEEQRAELHHRAAEALVAIHGEDDEEIAALLAWQYQGSGEWLKASQAAIMAADRSRRLGESNDALQTLIRVGRWLDRAPVGSERDGLLIEALLGQEEVCEVLGKQRLQGEILDRLLTIAEGSGNAALVGDIHRRRGDRFTLLRDFDRAREALASSLALGQESYDDAGVARALRSLGLIDWHTGNDQAGLIKIDQAIELDRARGDLEAVVSSLDSRGQLLKDCGRLPEALATFEEAIALCDEEGNDFNIAKCIALYGAGLVQLAMGEVDRAEIYFEKNATSSVFSRYAPHLESFRAVALSRLCLARGDYTGAIEQAEISVKMARKWGHADGLARSLHSLGQLLAAVGRDVEAVCALEEAAAVLRQLGRTDLEGDALAEMASLAERLGRRNLAHSTWQRCRNLAAGNGDVAAGVRARLGVSRTGTKARSDAAAELSATLELAESAGLPGEAAAAHNSIGIIAWESDDYQEALEHFESALGHLEQVEDSGRIAQMLNSIGRTHHALGNDVAARTILEQALELSRECVLPVAEGHALAILGDIEVDAGDLERAGELYRASLDLRKERGDRRGEGWMSRSLATVERGLGQAGAAEQHVRVAMAIAEELDDIELLKACRELLDEVQPVLEE